MEEKRLAIKFGHMGIVSSNDDQLITEEQEKLIRDHFASYPDHMIKAIFSYEAYKLPVDKFPADEKTILGICTTKVG